MLCTDHLNLPLPHPRRRQKENKTKEAVNMVKVDPPIRRFLNIMERVIFPSHVLLSMPTDHLFNVIFYRLLLERGPEVIVL